MGLEGQRCRRPQSVGQRPWGRSWQRWRCLLLHVVWIGGVRCRMELCKETEQQRASGTKEGFADIGSQRCDCADGDTSLQGCDDCLQPTGRIHGCCCACVLLIRGSPKPGRHRAALHPPPPHCVGQLCHHGYPHPPSAAVSEHRFMPSITFNAHFLCSFPPKHPTCSHHPPSLPPHPHPCRPIPLAGRTDEAGAGRPEAAAGGQGVPPAEQAGGGPGHAHAVPQEHAAAGDVVPDEHQRQGGGHQADKVR